MPHTLSETEISILKFEAPYLTEGLVKNDIVKSISEGNALFLEFKRYLIITRAYDECIWDMHSLRIDEVWHQFVLYTRQYIEFSFEYFGRYIQHSPANSPNDESSEVDDFKELNSTTFDEFRVIYENHFGIPLPKIWYDHKCVDLTSRVINKDHLNQYVQSDGDMAILLRSPDIVLLKTNKIAHLALDFVANTPSFYVRELPGSLSDEEKIQVISVLVEHSILKVGN